MQQDIKLDLTLDEVNVILVGLQEVAAKLSNPLSEKIRLQATPQLENTQKQPDLSKVAT